MRDTAPQGTYKVQALDRAFAVLDLLGESEVPLGLAQVASSLQLHKSTAHRFLMVLERHRMVERTTTGKFRLGLRLFDFGNRAIEQYDLRERAQPHLRRRQACLVEPPLDRVQYAEDGSVRLPSDANRYFRIRGDDQGQRAFYTAWAI